MAQSSRLSRWTSFFLHNAWLSGPAGTAWQNEHRAVCAGPLFNRLLCLSELGDTWNPISKTSM